LTFHPLEEGIWSSQAWSDFFGGLGWRICRGNCKGTTRKPSWRWGLGGHWHFRELWKDLQWGLCSNGDQQFLSWGEPGISLNSQRIEESRTLLGWMQGLVVEHRRHVQDEQLATWCWSAIAHF